MPVFQSLFFWLTFHEITMKQLSEDTGISVRTLTRMKKATREQNPKYMPSIRTLQEISKVTNLPIEDGQPALRTAKEGIEKKRQGQTVTAVPKPGSLPGVLAFLIDRIVRKRKECFSYGLPPYDQFKNHR